MIRSSDLEKATEILEFDNGIGTWRKSKDSNIILPSKTIEQKENNAIKIEPLIVNQLSAGTLSIYIYIYILWEHQVLSTAIDNYIKMFRLKKY